MRRRMRVWSLGALPRELDLEGCETVRDLRIRAHAAAVAQRLVSGRRPSTTRHAQGRRSTEPPRTASPRMPFFFRTPTSSESDGFFADKPPPGAHAFVLKVRGCRCWLPDDLPLNDMLGFVAAQLEVPEGDLRAPGTGPHAWPSGGGCARLCLVPRKRVGPDERRRGARRALRRVAGGRRRRRRGRGGRRQDAAPGGVCDERRRGRAGRDALH